MNELALGGLGEQVLHPFVILDERNRPMSIDQRTADGVWIKPGTAVWACLELKVMKAWPQHPRRDGYAGEGEVEVHLERPYLIEDGLQTRSLILPSAELFSSAKLAGKEWIDLYGKKKEKPGEWCEICGAVVKQGLLRLHQTERHPEIIDHRNGECKPDCSICGVPALTARDGKPVYVGNDVYILLSTGIRLATIVSQFQDMVKVRFASQSVDRTDSDFFSLNLVFTSVTAAEEERGRRGEAL